MAPRERARSELCRVETRACPLSVVVLPENGQNKSHFSMGHPKPTFGRVREPSTFTSTSRKLIRVRQPASLTGEGSRDFPVYSTLGLRSDLDWTWGCWYLNCEPSKCLCHVFTAHRTCAGPAFLSRGGVGTGTIIRSNRHEDGRCSTVLFVGTPTDF